MSATQILAGCVVLLTCGGLLLTWIVAAQGRKHLALLISLANAFNKHLINEHGHASINPYRDEINVFAKEAARNAPLTTPNRVVGTIEEALTGRISVQRKEWREPVAGYPSSKREASEFPPPPTGPAPGARGQVRDLNTPKPPTVRQPANEVPINNPRTEGRK